MNLFYFEKFLSLFQCFMQGVVVHCTFFLSPEAIAAFLLLSQCFLKEFLPQTRDSNIIVNAFTNKTPLKIQTLKQATMENNSQWEQENIYI